MPKFYMHIHDAGDFIEDIEGQNYTDLKSAQSDAEAAVRDLLAEKVKLGDEIDGQRIEIIDETGVKVAVVLFRDQLRFRQVSDEGKTDGLVISFRTH